MRGQASVRGTSFEFDTVNISVEKGTVAFSGKTGAAAMVNSGSATFVSPEGTAVNPVEVVSAALLPLSPAGTPENKTRAAGAMTLTINLTFAE